MSRPPLTVAKEAAFISGGLQAGGDVSDEDGDDGIPEAGGNYVSGVFRATA